MRLFINLLKKFLLKRGPLKGVKTYNIEKRFEVLSLFYFLLDF